jgi:hypothetical protein
MCLAKAVAADLASLGETRVVGVVDELSPAERQDLLENGYHLIVMAMGSPYSEPLVALARASLAQAAGTVPILIISDRYFDSDTEARIAHLDYPCDAEALFAAASALLDGSAPIH